MWQDREVDYQQSRLISRHCKDYFKGSIFAKESEVRGISDGHLHPTVDSLVTNGGEKIEFWYKLFTKLLEHDINNIMDEKTVQKMSSVDLIVGGDHGKGQFCVVLMLIIRTENNQHIKKRFIAGEIDCKKESVNISLNSGF